LFGSLDEMIKRYFCGEKSPKNLCADDILGIYQNYKTYRQIYEEAKEEFSLPGVIVVKKGLVENQQFLDP